MDADWRVLDGVLTTWFERVPLTAGAELAARVLEVSPGAAVDLRANGVRVRLGSAEHADAVSAAARDLGLTADPAVLQQLDVVIESAQPAAVGRFWRDVLAYAPGPDGALVDPLRRDPSMRIRSSSESRPLRNHIHLDVVRPTDEVEPLGDGTGPYGVRHADPDGNEVDLVPGDPLGDGPATADWRTVFSAMACYCVTSTTQQGELATAAARLADDAGFPLSVDLRPGLVVLDSGKDRWDADAHGLDVEFTDLAASLQSAARDLGATADARLPRFVQVFLDATDVPAVRAFWTAALGYTPDRRDGVSDIVDPRRLNPVLVFQQIDVSDADRLRQWNRIHLELAVPADQMPTRLATILAAGGRLLDESTGVVADPEGNELVVVSAGPSRPAP